jgi:TnpA family transposase
LSETTRISDQIKFLLDNPPNLSNDERDLYFNLSETHKLIIEKLENKIGFILQLVYFKASHRFYKSTNFKDVDIAYAEAMLDVEDSKVKENYPNRSKTRHREVILNSLGIISYSETSTIFQSDLTNLANKHVDPEILIKELTFKAKNRKSELPSNYQLAKKINSQLVNTEKKLMLSFNAAFNQTLNPELSDKFASFLEPIVQSDGTDSNRPMLTKYKKIIQSYKPRKLSESLKDFLLFKQLYLVISPIIKSLMISEEVIQHYAIWIVKAKIFQINQKENEKINFYLACFVCHYYLLRQDALTSSIIKGVSEYLNCIKREQKVVSVEAQQIYGKLTTSLKLSRDTLKEYLEQVAKIAQSNLSQAELKIEIILEVLQDLHDLEKNKETEAEINDYLNQANAIKEAIDEYTLLEKYSVKIQNRAVNVIPHLVFSEHTSNTQLLSAVNYFKDKQNAIDHRAPTSFLSESEIDKLYDETNKFKVSLYKSLLITKFIEAVKSGVINLKESYKYSTLQKYLIPKNEWNLNKSDYIKKAELGDFDDIKEILKSLTKKLSFQYRNTNDNMINGTNKFISFDKDGRPIVRTPAVVKIETSKISDIFKEVKYVSVLDVLNQVNHNVNFIEAFKHHSVAATKVKPSSEIFYAALIGIGCNIGIHKLAGTAKGISLSKVENVANWYINKEGLYRANQKMIKAIDALDLPNKLCSDPNIRHGSSDGMQVKIKVESLNSNQSYKYSGISKGVSVYSFIDNRCVLFHSTVISPEEREAAYVIDGFYHNDEVKIDIHSTDTHGFTEIIFAVTYLLNIAFAPRLKSLKRQALYSFDSLKLYKNLGYKLCPKKIIQEAKIEEQWDEVLRLIASIKLRKATASQIFKRLSSYSLENPLYKALKEFGRIIKSIFILVYYHDLQLRQSIQKQLNLVELSNKFSKAVFFDHNSEFRSQEAKEEQEIAVLCKQLIQNAIIYWNYCYLTQKLINANDPDEEAKIFQVISNGSVMSWGHINMYGEYDFSRTNNQNYKFDMPLILKYLVT